MNKTQKITIAVMALIGLLLAVLMLMPRRGAGPATAAAPAEQAAPEHGGHADAQPEKIALDDIQAKAAGVALAVAAPARISVAITLPGEIRFNEDRTAHVVPKLAGVVTSVRAELGQNVKQGQVLAVIASSGLSEQRSELLSAQRRLALAGTTFERERRLWQDKISAEQDYLQAQQALSEAEIAVRNARQKLSAIGAGAGTGTTAAAAGAELNRLELRAPFDGVVMEKHLALGEALKEDAAVFTISDLSGVWAEIAVPPKDLALVRVGETVVVKASAFDAQASGKITYVGSLLGEQTRTAKARVALANPDRAWRPGLFVSVDVLSGQADAAAVTVLADAIQTVEDKPVVFVKVAGGFRAQPVLPGRSDGKRTEILKGLAAGAQYAAAGSFVLKAELGKDSAEHAH
ncbi:MULTISPECIES: efflux RND transporter periplasmic adaptor subunit [unclassified Duganella]|uniref:efflux RND transporter periplasmic adaptor subunit n=1 Tax=unclassified Duganella TaxID=2636909 RepID=UPI000E356AA5|nr:MULTISPECIES: efflux RND transporter periplasmic adaptor subunit [unclassified Duganella]RFP08192.1 efflux RND transporter periplasmic adaptor subunit [Duganella sp. BJB475]RFP22486.1 efflux RND transporter periplasmic adaptor subunit [Duganella sp. BJB476]